MTGRDGRAADSRSFPPTAWSNIRRARAGSAQEIDRLAQDYYEPVYRYVRQMGHKEEEARDLTQTFFLHILKGEMLRAADPGRGRFRDFLLASLRNLVRDEHDRAQRLKRGGGIDLLSLDFEDAERTLDLAAKEDPEEAFNREFAEGILAREILRRRRT